MPTTVKIEPRQVETISRIPEIHINHHWWCGFWQLPYEVELVGANEPYYIHYRTLFFARRGARKLLKKMNAASKR